MRLSALNIAYQRIGDEDANRLASTRNAENCIVVSESAAALDAAEQAAQAQSDIILVVDQQDQIKGIVAIPSVQDRVQQILHRDTEDFHGAVLALEDDFEKSMRERPREIFHHEWLNESRPDLYWCEKGRHFVTRLPCGNHS